MLLRSWVVTKTPIEQRALRYGRIIVKIGQNTKTNNFVFRDGGPCLENWTRQAGTCQPTLAIGSNNHKKTKERKKRRKLYQVNCAKFIYSTLKKFTPEKYLPLKNNHSQKYSLLKNIRHQKIFTPEKIFTLTNA